MKKESDNSSIGIIICKTKNRTMVEYALKSLTNPIGVATYRYSDLPNKIAEFLPNEEEIKKRLLTK